MQSQSLDCLLVYLQGQCSFSRHWSFCIVYAGAVGGVLNTNRVLYSSSVNCVCVSIKVMLAFLFLLLFYEILPGSLPFAIVTDLLKWHSLLLWAQFSKLMHVLVRELKYFTAGHWETPLFYWTTQQSMQEYFEFDLFLFLVSKCCRPSVSETFKGIRLSLQQHQTLNHRTTPNGLLQERMLN